MEFLQMSASFGRIILAHALTFSLNENLKFSRAFVLFHEKICEIFHFINFYEIALWNSLKCRPNSEGEFQYMLGLSAQIGI